jgi:hypothetical protein
VCESWWVKRRIEDGDAEGGDTGGGDASERVMRGSWMWPAYVRLVNEFDPCDPCLETAEGSGDDGLHLGLGTEDQGRSICQSDQSGTIRVTLDK